MLKRLLIIAGALACCLPSAPAALGAEGEAEEVSVHFFLPGSHGYRILVYATAFAEGEIERLEAPGEVTLTAIKGSRQYASYRAEAMVTESGLEADLGALGRIDLELRLSGKEGTVRAPRCKGPAQGFEKATYRGSFEFRGEEGFTSATASRIPVSPKAILGLICSNHFEVQTEDLRPGAPGASLHSEGGRRSGGRVVFQVVKSRPDGRTLVRVTVGEKRRGIEIGRAVEFVTGTTAFRYDSALSTASVDLPAPFAGAATYRLDAAPARRWSGDLTVDMPGRADLPLVRPALTPALVPAAWIVAPPEFE